MTRWSIAGAFLLASGCIHAPDPQPACPAPDLTYLIGQPEDAATGISHDGVIRIIQPGMAITEDYSPSRLNIEIDEDGRIARLYCG